MAVLIDPPAWPAHGTVFSHLVSDSSLAELHAFAAAAGVPWRAFDHDHYDVPKSTYNDLVAAGAEAVTGRELVTRLLASGLRVKPIERTPSRAQVLPGLQADWRNLLPSRPGLGEELLARWQEPHRAYHDVRHLAQALTAAIQVNGGQPSRAVRLALWFHDAVYAFAPGKDEEDSAQLATDLLGSAGLPVAEVDEVARLVRLTASHSTRPGDTDGAVVLDADLSVLALLPGRYDVYVRDVRTEYSHVPEADFRQGRLQVIAQLQSLTPLYSTSVGKSVWETVARRNLDIEKSRWLGILPQNLANS